MAGWDGWLQAWPATRPARFSRSVTADAAVQPVDPDHVVAQQFAFRAGPEIQLVDLVARAHEVEHGKIGAEDHLVLAEGVDVVDELLGPVLRAVGVGADVDVLVLPRHRDHLPRPRDADVDADQFQLREIAGHRVERDGLADAAAAVVLRVDHGLAHLHLDGHAEFHALGVEGVVLRVVGGQLEPVRIEVGADEAELFHRPLQLAHAVHAGVGIDADQAGEMPGILLDGAGDDLRRHVIAARQAGAAGLRRHQEGVADAGLAHALDHLRQRESAHETALGFHLADEEVRTPVRAHRQRFLGPDVHDGVDGPVFVGHGSSLWLPLLIRYSNCSTGVAPEGLRPVGAATACDPRRHGNPQNLIRLVPA